VVAGESDVSKPLVQVDGTSSSTPTLLQTSSPILSQTSTGLPEILLPTSSSVLPSGLYVYIQAPSGTVPRPYVILRAFSALPGTVSVTIRGFINSQEFICTGSPCAIDLQSSSRLVFAAYAETGESSETVIASVSVTQVTDGYLVTIDSVSQFTLFTNSCSLVWGQSDRNNATWDEFVQFPYELNTKKTLHYLATQLLITGIVDASSCPAGGLSIGLNWPTACGLERATSKMIEFQNQYDEHIWLASRDHGIPPKILKTLIEVETQFWPGNSRFYLDEYGLGQVSQLGMDVLLRRDPTLYLSICPSVLSNCTTPYPSLPPEQQAMIRGAVLSLMDASCPTCAYGLDFNKAKESVSILARLLKANCEQVDYILSLPFKPDEDVDVATATAAAATLAAGGNPAGTTYEDLWRFTFLAYHSGLSCFQEAVIATKRDKQPVTWDNLRERLNCRGGRDYVDGFMGNLLSFDFYRLQPSETTTVLVAPTIIPTRTPMSTPTAIISTAIVRVEVFMDRNGNNAPDDGEWIDAMTVLLETSTNQQITQRTENGIAIFDMTGYPPGIGINVTDAQPDVTESAQTGSQNEETPSELNPQEEAIEMPPMQESSRDENPPTSTSAETKELDHEDLLDDVRRSLIDEEADQSQKESQKDSKWWRRVGRKGKRAEPEKLPENVEIDLPIMLERTDVVAEPAQKLEPEKQLDDIDNLIDMLQAETEETVVETNVAPDVEIPREPELDFETRKEQAFRPREAIEESENVSDVRSVALEGGEEVFVEVQAPVVSPVEERLSAFENALRPYRWYVNIALAFFGVVVVVIAGLIMFNVYQQSRPQPVQEVSNLPYPTSVSLPGGWSFNLGKGNLQAGRWEPQGPEWLEGTEICRWVALPWSRQLEAVIRTLNPEDPIELGMSNNDKLVYQVYSVRQLTPEEIQQLDSNSPCLLVILSQPDSEERWVLTALP
jgi:hypothetical protein